MLGFEISQNPFLGCPSWQRVAKLPFAEKIAILRAPEFRARLLAEHTADPALAHRLNTWEKIFPLGDRPDYEPSPEQSVAAQAASAGIPPAEMAYRMLLEKDGRNILYRPIINYADGDLGAVAEMMQDPNTLMGLGDGGAHVSIICDASAPTTMITHWTRDRTRGARLPLEWVIKRLTRDNALALGLADRGLLAPGLKADLNIIDYDRLCAHAPEVLYDLPAGGRRLVQRTEGYVATILAGVPVHRDGQATGALPGRLIRGAQPHASDPVYGG
jgi:N-acyl-D-aspartate/D-glutamate deacylase